MSDTGGPLLVEQSYPWQFFSGFVPNGGTGTFNTIPASCRCLITYMSAGINSPSAGGNVFAVVQAPSTQFLWIAIVPPGNQFIYLNCFIVFDPTIGVPTIVYDSGSGPGLAFQIHGYLLPR